MSELILAAVEREQSGKGAARKLRRGGEVPGIVYGAEAPQSIQVPEHEASLIVKQLHGAERLISLQVAKKAGGAAKERHVIIKEVQIIPVGQKLLHIDFHEIDMGKPVQVGVEVRATGKAEGVIMGGILQTLSHEVTVECLPSKIPEYLAINVEALNIGDSLHVREIVLPDGVKMITPEDDTVFVVSAPLVEEVAGEEELVEGAEEAEDQAATDEKEESAE